MNELPSDYSRNGKYHFLSKIEFPSRTNLKQRPVLKSYIRLEGNDQAKKVDLESTFSTTSLRNKSLFKEHVLDEHRSTMEDKRFAVKYEAKFNHVVEGGRLPGLQRTAFLLRHQRKETPNCRNPKELTPLKKFSFRTETRKKRCVKKPLPTSLNIGCKGDTKSSSDDVVSFFPNDRSLLLQKRPKKKFHEDTKYTHPLHPSLFPNVPPYLNFILSEKAKRLPTEIRNSLQWKLSNTTPTLVTQIISRSGFQIAEDGAAWTFTWGKHVNCHLFKELDDNQKVNHFPGTFHLGRKDSLWMNILKMQLLHGKEHFSFMPQTFILPQHLKHLRSAWLEAGCRSRWIIKPPASARGIGVSVVHRWNDVPKLESVIIQKYISRPYLINGTKFDLRLYILVTSFDPLRLYVFDDGLVRFASKKYSRSYKCLGEKFIHLTNYSINRNNTCYTTNEDENVCQGHKWTLKCLWSYFRENGIDDRKVWSSLVDIVIKTLISCEEPVNRLVKIYAKNRYSCYELFGFDVMLDYSLKPWLLEVNSSPSLHSNSKLDIKVKGKLIKDTFNTVGFHIPAEVNLSRHSGKTGIRVQKGISWNKDLYGFVVNREERAKQIKFEKNGWSQSSILKNLSSDDVRQIIQSEDELSRCGNFVRVFPSETSYTYLRFFDTPRYYNLLLDAWERRHYNRRNAGILLLQSLCKSGMHLKVANSKDEIRANTVESLRSKITDKCGRNMSATYQGDLLVPTVPQSLHKKSKVITT